MVVKKYGNRRLYDTEESRYVRLAEVAEKVRRGVDVRVVDATTDADLTAETLVQIIFEDRHAARLLPVSLLQQMIRMGDDALAEFLGRYLTVALEMYLQARQGLTAFSPLAAFAPLAHFANPFAPRAPVSSTPPARPPSTPPPAVDDPRPDPRPPAAPTAADARRDDDVAALRRELDALKKSLRKRTR